MARIKTSIAGSHVAHRLLAVLVAVAAISLYLARAQATVTVSEQPIVALLQVDSTMPDEQIPHGVPSFFDWYSHPVVHDATDVHGYPYADPWGQVYDVATGNPLPRDRVEVRDLQMWVLSKSTGQWTALYSTPPAIGGGLYPETYQGSPVGASIDATAAPGSILVSPNIRWDGTLVAGYQFHFFPSIGRVRIDPADVAAIVVQARVRLAQTNPVSPEYAGLVADVGADFWACPACGTGSGSGEGRMVTVKHDWRVITYTTETLAQLQTNPAPPITADPAEDY
jgi:hypothetical protein